MVVDNKNQKRVVVTGIGVITPVGIGKEIFWRSMTEGRSGIDEITGFDTSDFKMHRGCEVKDFYPGDFGLNPQMGRTSSLAAAAAMMAVDDSGASLDKFARRRVGVSLGTTGGEIQLLEKVCSSLTGGTAEDEIDRDYFSGFPCDVLIEKVSGILNIKGPGIVFPNACAAGNYAVGYACDLIRKGRADLMIAGGVDAMSRMAFTGFSRLNSVAPDNCKPFDKNRKGIILGEGAGMTVLEPLESAVERGADIYAEISGYGISCDSYHVTSPDPQGRGMLAAMSRALVNSNLKPGDVDYINAHGTGTPVNDRIETMAIKGLFNEHAYQLCVSSIKSMIGHTMGAAGAIETIACSMAVLHDIIPPTINYETRDPECDLNYVPNVKVEKKINIAMNNAFAFGGNNTCIIIKKYIL